MFWSIKRKFRGNLFVEYYAVKNIKEPNELMQLVLKKSTKNILIQNKIIVLPHKANI